MSREPVWVRVQPRFGFAALLPLAAGVFAVAAPPAPPVNYTREIRPILAENCFTCHGPDVAARKAGLRLDVPNAAVKRALLARVTAKPESGALMPPPETHKKLTPAQIAKLKLWVAQGGHYDKHWSFVSVPKTVPVPPTKNKTWARNPIDKFVLARLERESLTPSKEASRTEWLRRVSLDLTGILPTLAEADAFLADKTPTAYEKVVDRLLASPHFGEQQALPWLDIARYADSYGYQSDQLSPTWPYRDWVVKAFNDNLPYNQFVTQQLAGDLLPGATRETRLATAFNRLHRMTNEGGSVPEEWRLEYVADRVRTFGTAFLGLTLECARCHDHKYDPVTQRDFYAFSAFFNSIDEHGLYNQSDIVPTPTVLLPTPEQETALEQAKAGVIAAEKALDDTKSARAAAFAAWQQGKTELSSPDLVAHYGFESLDEVPHVDEVKLVEGKQGLAALLTGDNNVNFPGKANFTRHTPFTIQFWMRDPRQLTEPMVVFHASSGTDVGFHGYDLLIENGVLTARIFRHWPGNAIAISTPSAVVPKDTWTKVALTYDGSSRAAGLKLYINGSLAATQPVRDHLWKGTGAHTLAFGERFRDRGFKGGLLDELSIYSRALTPLELGSTTDTVTSRAEYYFSAIDPETRAATAALAAAREKVWRAEDPMREVAVMEELPQPRPSYVLARGAYDAPRSQRAARGVPAVFGGGTLKDRLALAQWLTRPDHPLTARVAVNRFWQQLFGRGLVETAEDFGIQGRLPTHPELLDWLARDFLTDGNMKRALKQLVLSATYRQGSARRPDLEKKDPQNLLLARGPSYRYSAETIRDIALAASGLLKDTLGGPPVSPYQPGDLWREANTMSPAYRQSVGTDLYRRSLYTVWKRTAPMPNMVAFDAAGREVCVARRQATSTPLQALVLLNDPQFVEAARALGERILKDGGPTDASRVRYAFRRLAVREPTATEARLLEALYTEQRTAFAADLPAAQKLLTVGASKPDPTLAPAELAAATTLAQAILNLDATIWKR